MSDGITKKGRLKLLKTLHEYKAINVRRAAGSMQKDKLAEKQQQINRLTSKFDYNPSSRCRRTLTSANDDDKWLVINEFTYD